MSDPFDLEPSAATPPNMDQSRVDTHAPGDDCPHCRGLAARVAELERRLSDVGSDAEAKTDPTAPASSTSPLVIKALRLLDHGWGEGWALRPSPPRRHWMDQARHPYLCLPLVMANQWGWQVLCPTDVRVIWDGSSAPSGLRIEVAPKYAPVIKSQFGTGIVTFSPPWLFRTSPGWDLYAKGPGNRWKVNCVPLEGVIETWWLNYTFTLNWKLVEPGVVTFARGESLGQLVPVPHDTFAGSSAIEAPITIEEPAAAEELLEWMAARKRIADTDQRSHHLYRKAEDIEGHLTRVPVPPFVPKGNAAGQEGGANGQPAPA